MFNDRCVRRCVWARTSQLHQSPLRKSRVACHGKSAEGLIRRTAVVRTRMPGGVGGAASRDAPIPIYSSCLPSHPHTEDRQRRYGARCGRAFPVGKALLERGMSRRVRTSRERKACTATSFDGASCRLFFARCRIQVLICRRCDRGQIYCAGICAQEARRERPREARRRNQATPGGRAMHAERNRRYRDRRRCVTDHGLSGAQGERFVPPVNTASTDRPSQRNRTWTGALPSLPPIGVGVSAPLIPTSSSRRPPISPSTLMTGHTARPGYL